MKKLPITNFVLSFVALIGVDIDTAPLWAVGLLLIWFVASVLLLRKAMPELWAHKK